MKVIYCKNDRTTLRSAEYPIWEIDPEQVPSHFGTFLLDIVGLRSKEQSKDVIIECTQQEYEEFWRCIDIEQGYDLFTPLYDETGIIEEPRCKGPMGLDIQFDIYDLEYNG